MPSIDLRYGFLAVVAVGTLLVASFLAEIPQLRLAGTTLATQSVLGVAAGLLTISVAVSELRGGDRRSALYFGLLGVGVALALSGWTLVASFGAVLTLLSAAVAWRVDRHVRRLVGDDAS